MKYLVTSSWSDCPLYVCKSVEAQETVFLFFCTGHSTGREGRGEEQEEKEEGRHRRKRIKRQSTVEKQSTRREGGVLTSRTAPCTKKKTVTNNTQRQASHGHEHCAFHLEESLTP